MLYRRLGKDGPEVSVLTFGAWQLGDHAYWGESEQHDAAGAVEAALDGGINLFDTAEVYGQGESERVLGQVLGAHRKDVYVATKVLPQHCHPERLRAACEASLKRLNTDYIDLYQVHWPFAKGPYQDAGGHWVEGDTAIEEAQAILEKLKAEGKIRWFGVSNFGPQSLKTWKQTGRLVSNQVAYSLLFRAVEYEIVPICRKEGVGVLAYMPLMQGILSGRWRTVEEIPPKRRRTRHFSGRREGTRHQEDGCERLLMNTLAELRELSEVLELPLATMSLAWLMRQPGVTSVVVGARRPDQVRRNLLSAQLDLGPALTARLNTISGNLKHAMGPNADLWQSGEQARVK
ncbi:MAG: aldo/keto reductase [Candidatus Hydrogenedentes bacterium]|nr:aldo/keto reductase [Candidatus Hydrogenedentota bacterium]